MTLTHRCTLALLLATTVTHAAEQTAPFEIPPTGEPERLIGCMDVEGPTALAFDSANRPYMFEARDPEHFGYILTLRDGAWVRLDYLDALRTAYPQLIVPTERRNHAAGTLAIDGQDRIYAIIRCETAPDVNRSVLLYSDDHGASFDVHELPRGGAYLEIGTGHNTHDVPPAIGSLRKRKDHPARWTAYHDLSVYIPSADADGLSLGEPIAISSNCFGMSTHSGGYSFAVTRDGKTHVTYAEIATNSVGNPTYVTTIDRDTRQVLRRRFVLDAPPKKPDVHSTPVIAADREGHLHLLSGAHNNPFLYSRSTQPGAADDTWATPKAQSQKQTYATLVCDSKNRLHTVYREHPRLLYVHKDAEDKTWSEPRVLAHAPAGHKGYTIFYHRFFIDRADTLYLSFTFYEFHTGDAGRYPRALAVSEDGGASWRLATTASIAARILDTD